jgi:predicted DCC family thiol-disulfide oxidoreductase YuxK
MATATTKTKSFPTPDERPGADFVLIFDGHCNFCRANIAWISAVDRGRIAYLSLHDAEVHQRWPELTHQQLMDRMYLVDVNSGRKYGGAEAFRFLSKKLIALWPLAPLLHIPGSLPLWQFLYSSVARVRYKFGRIEECEDGSCNLHFD